LDSVTGLLLEFDSSTGSLFRSIGIEHSGHSKTSYSSEIYIDEDDNIYLTGEVEDVSRDAILTKLKITKTDVKALWSLVWGGDDTDSAKAAISGSPYTYLTGITYSTSRSGKLIKPILFSLNELA